MSDELSLQVFGSHPERRKVGRPRAAVAGAKLSTWVPTPLYDHLVKQANNRNVSVSKLVAVMLSVQIKRTP